MKELRLTKLTLTAFKGISTLTLDFGGHSAALYGANGLGKTTIYDAWLWLLTGKDSGGMVPDDTKGFQIKPLSPAGDVLDNAAHSVVEAEITVDGAPITLRKEYYEKWTRKRGAAEASYDGNTTDYYINDVPRTKREYEDYLTGIVQLDVLHLLSHTGAFAALPDADRRGILFEMAQIGEERDLMAQDERFAPLLAATGSLSLSEYQRQLTARQKQCNKELNILPARLDEVRRTLAGLKDIPFDEIRRSVADLEREAAELSLQLTQQAEGQAAQIRTEIAQCDTDLKLLEAENRAHRTAQQSGQPDTSALRRELNSLRTLLQDAQACQRREQRDVERCESERERCRAKWAEIKQEQYPASATCPTCGQPLPEDRQRAARDNWERERKRRLDAVVEEGKRYAKCVDAYTQREQAARERCNELATQLGVKSGELELMEAAPAVTVTDLPDYENKKEAIAARRADAQTRLAEAERGEAERREPLIRRQSAVLDELTELRRQAARETLLTSAEGREAELMAQQQRTAQELEQADEMLDCIDSFTRYKASFVTDTINALFRLVTFRLFRQQVNGGLVDCCDILVDGVPYHRGLNTGARVNAGLDMIEALSRHYGVSVPVFVDGAESVTDLHTGDGQFVRLTVSETDRKLRFETV